MSSSKVKIKYVRVPVDEEGNLLLAGTAEAAEMLDVERPRIGRWMKAGLMPRPLAKLRATPIWTVPQIEAMKGERESRRRAPAA